MASSYNLRTKPKQQLWPSPKPSSKQTSSSSTSKQPPTTSSKPLTETPNQQDKNPSNKSNSTLASTQLLPIHAPINANNLVSEYSLAEINSNSIHDFIIGNALVDQCKKKSINFTDDLEGASAAGPCAAGLLAPDKVDDLADLEVSGLKLPHCYKSYHEAEGEFTERKQYRGVKHGVVGIPYRKFQTQLEQKIVMVINKMKQQKNCVKQISKLLAKIENVTGKDLKNRYFLSGVAIIIKLMAQANQFYSQDDRNTCQDVLDGLKKKIEQDLDCMDNLMEGCPEGQVVITMEKSKLFNRIYRILKRKYDKNSMTRDQLQEQAIELVVGCEGEKGVDIRALFGKIGEIRTN